MSQVTVMSQYTSPGSPSLALLQMADEASSGGAKWLDDG
jgi:hypothetical protein